MLLGGGGATAGGAGGIAGTPAGGVAGTGAGGAVSVGAAPTGGVALGPGAGSSRTGPGAGAGIGASAGGGPEVGARGALRSAWSTSGVTRRISSVMRAASSAVPITRGVISDQQLRLLRSSAPSRRTGSRASGCS